MTSTSGSLDIAEKATALLRRFYGYSQFRPGQLDIITTVMSGRDTLVLMPTGGGKSMCYQIPALLGNGCTVVVSPLISLMKDQVSALNANGIPAAAVNSGCSDADNRMALHEARRGHIKLLYMSPERLMLELEHSDMSCWVDLFAIDEAHCISQWGHDFRPEYAALGVIKQKAPGVPILALTATADKVTRDDIALRLALHNPQIYISSFDRANLSLRVMTASKRAQKVAYIGGLIGRYPDDSGIVYCLSRKGAEAIHGELLDKGYRSIVYHAGLTPAQRNKAQEAFINGDVQVVCATVAFGMGIDKSNVRWVVHINMPRNIESYYQEIGRAGRDGLSAETTLFYSYADVATLQSFNEQSGQAEVNARKLQRMVQYCESLVCRRRVLLSYFNEEMDHDCGNCDVCLSPPERFDGTIFAQMALSGVARAQESIGVNMLIDILRGSAKAEIVRAGYDKLRTYGVGRAVSSLEWLDFIQQLIHLGALDVAYNSDSHLKITPYGWRILRSEAEVMLARRPKEVSSKRTSRTSKKDVAVDDTPANPDEQLFSRLKALRRELALRDGKAPYMVFSDKTLLEMTRQRPVTMAQFIQIEGVGERKCVKYWAPFTAVIKEFI